MSMVFACLLAPVLTAAWRLTMWGVLVVGAIVGLLTLLGALTPPVRHSRAPSVSDAGNVEEPLHASPPMGTAADLSSSKQSTGDRSIVSRTLRRLRDDLERMDRALGARDAAGAVSAWRDARIEALRTRGWEALAEVAEASLRLGDVPGRHQSVPAAREALLASFFRARRAASLDGILRSAEDFARLGDRVVAGYCLDAADEIARRSTAEAQARASEARRHLPALARPPAETDVSPDRERAAVTR